MLHGCAVHWLMQWGGSRGPPERRGKRAYELRSDGYARCEHALEPRGETERSRRAQLLRTITIHLVQVAIRAPPDFTIVGRCWQYHFRLYQFGCTSVF